MRKIVLSLILLMVFAVGTASAGPLTISNIVGSWINPAPPVPAVTIANAINQGTDTIRWGDPVNGIIQSGYNFTPAGGTTIPTVTPFATPFLLGTFVHVNQPIYPPSLESVEYAFSFSTNGTPISFSNTFSFTHNETTNTATQAGCLGGNLGVPCDDFVTVSSLSLNGNIDVDGKLYYFNLLGFSTNGGLDTTNQFRTLEGFDNTAGLYGVVTEVPIENPVPEPASILLFGSGLVGLAGAARRRFRK